MSAFESIKQGLEEAKAFSKGQGTLLNWEHGRRTPNGPAQVLLALISRKPSVVQDLLGSR